MMRWKFLSRQKYRNIRPNLSRTANTLLHGRAAALGWHHQLTLSAMTRHSGFFSIAAIHFSARLIAVIELKALKFSAWPAGMQR
jgi:hypothetical protein